MGRVAKCAALWAVVGLVGAPAAVQAQPARPGRLPAPAAARAPRNLAVVGITRIGDRPQVWLVDRTTQQRQNVSPGETAFGYRVQSVNGEHVVLSRDGQQFTMRLGEGPPPPAPAPRVAETTPGVEAVAGSRQTMRARGGRIRLPAARGVDPSAAGLVDPGFVDPVSEVPEQFTDGRAGAGLPALPGGEGQAPDPELGWDPRFGLPPGYAFEPGIGVVPGVGLGVDPRALGYPWYAGYPGPAGGALPGYPGGSEAYPGYPAGAFGGQPGPMGPYPYGAYPGYPGWGGADPSYGSWIAPGGMSPGMAPYALGTGNPAYLSRTGGARWNSQTTRRRLDNFQGSGANPQTLRRRRNTVPGGP